MKSLKEIQDLVAEAAVLTAISSESKDLWRTFCDKVRDKLNWQEYALHKLSSYNSNSELQSDWLIAYDVREIFPEVSRTEIAVFHHQYLNSIE